MSWAVACFAGLMAVVAAALAVTRPNIVHALMLFVAGLIALAAAFFALNASFAGAIQILIYAGAIIAVFVFVVMTADTGAEALAAERRGLLAAWKAPAAVAGLIVLVVTLGLGVSIAAGDAPVPTTARDLGLLLFGPWAIVTELASLLLLAGLLGVRHLARRRAPSPEDAP